MKKNIVLLLIFLITLCGCSSNKLGYVSENIELNLDNCKMVYENDTHGGFLGDGDYFSKIVCNSVDENVIKFSWEPLPLGEEIQNIMDLVWCIDECKTTYERYNIPNIENGYYYFIDRHSETTDSKKYDEINERSSYNFSLALYDSLNKTIYYYELDT